MGKKNNKWIAILLSAAIAFSSSEIEVTANMELPQKAISGNALTEAESNIPEKSNTETDLTVNHVNTELAESENEEKVSTKVPQESEIKETVTVELSGEESEIEEIVTSELSEEETNRKETMVTETPEESKIEETATTETSEESKIEETAATETPEESKIKETATTETPEESEIKDTTITDMPEETNTEEKDTTEIAEESEVQETTHTEILSETLEENEIDIIEEESTTEESEAQELLLPGMKNYTLSREQSDSMDDLRRYISDIQELEEGLDYVDGQLVFLAESEEEALEIAGGYGGELESFRYGVGIVNLPQDISVISALEFAACQAKDVIMAPAWPNYYRTIYGEDNYINIEELNEMVLTYNDPFLEPSNEMYQWQHAMVGSTYAWENGYTGSGVKVAVLDTGVNSHEDLEIAVNENFVSKETETGDLEGHGTHVAGLVAAKLNNIGGVGVAPEASIVNLRVLGKRTGTDADIMVAVNRAIELKVDIINMSLGGPQYNGEFATVVKNAYDAGIAVIVAAGNSGSRAMVYPACYDGAYAVGAVQQDTGKAYFSNYGEWVRFGAPGYQLWSTSNNGTYEVKSGTSQAAPVIAGTAAVILSANEEIQGMSGSARVDALIESMEQGLTDAKGGAAKLISIPKALGITTYAETPKAPVFSIKNGEIISKEEELLEITAASPDFTIYYTLNGKNPVYKNGIAGAGTEKYMGVIPVGGASKVTVKAVAVNRNGVAGPIATSKYNFKPSVSKIEVSGANIALKGKTVKLQAAVLPTYAVNKKLIWTSDNSGVTVDSKGNVKISKSASGICTITVKSADSQSSAEPATFVITIAETAKIKKVAFTKSKNTIYSGLNNEPYDLKTFLKVTRQDNTLGGTEDVTWSSSNAKVAKVSEEGVVTDYSAGKAKITALANDGSGKKAVFTLTIKQQATGLVLEGSNKLAISKSIKLTAKAYPENAVKPSLKWEISPENQGVTISNGKVKAGSNAKEGIYKITVTSKSDETIKGEFEVLVSDNAIKKIVLDNKKLTIFRTQGASSDADASKQMTSAQISADIQAKNPDQAAVEFVSSNPGIVTVEQHGTMATVRATGKSTGTTKITCKAVDGSGKSATCTVAVINAASGFSIVLPSDRSAYIGNGSKVKLTANFDNGNGKLSNTKVKWESSNPDIVSVDSKGTVKGHRDWAEEAVITATALDGSGATASVKLYSCTQIGILELRGGEDFESYYLSEGKMYRFYYTANGNEWYKNGTCPYVSVEVGDNSILNVVPDYQNSCVYISTFQKRGTTTLTMKAMDGSNKKVIYDIQVGPSY